MSATESHRGHRPVDLHSWGNNPPHYIVLLAEAVQRSTRQQVAEELGYSRTAISLALLNKYCGGLRKLGEAVLYRYDQVDCPLLGEITNDYCQSLRQQPFTASNHQRIQQFRACRSCPNNSDVLITEEVSNAN